MRVVSVHPAALDVTFTNSDDLAQVGRELGPSAFARRVKASAAYRHRTSIVRPKQVASVTALRSEP